MLQDDLRTPLAKQEKQNLDDHPIDRILTAYFDRNNQIKQSQSNNNYKSETRQIIQRQRVIRSFLHRPDETEVGEAFVARKGHWPSIFLAVDSETNHDRYETESLAHHQYVSASDALCWVEWLTRRSNECASTEHEEGTATAVRDPHSSSASYPSRRTVTSFPRAVRYLTSSSVSNVTDDPIAFHFSESTSEWLAFGTVTFQIPRSRSCRKCQKNEFLEEYSREERLSEIDSAKSFSSSTEMDAHSFRTRRASSAHHEWIRSLEVSADKVLIVSTATHTLTGRADGIQRAKQSNSRVICLPSIVQLFSRWSEAEETDGATARDRRWRV